MMSVRLANKTFHVGRIFIVLFVSIASIICLYSLREQLQYEKLGGQNVEKIANWNFKSENEKNRKLRNNVEYIDNERKETSRGNSIILLAIGICFFNI